jgi:chaperone modulatory protein CbpM
MIKKHYQLKEACEQLGAEQSFIIHCIEAHWVVPAEPEISNLDEEDLARLRLILELQRDFGVNDESISIILHLLDQLYLIRSKIKNVA